MEIMNKSSTIAAPTHIPSTTHNRNPNIEVRLDSSNADLLLLLLLLLPSDISAYLSPKTHLRPSELMKIKMEKELAVDCGGMMMKVDNVQEGRQNEERGERVVMMMECPLVLFNSQFLLLHFNFCTCTCLKSINGVLTLNLVIVQKL